MIKECHSNDKLHPAMRCGEVSTIDQQATLVELIVPPCPSHAIAVVFDMSDSCGSLQREIKALPRLVASLPRAWPLWFYRLSDVAPIRQAEDLQIGHLQDMCVSPSDWVENELNAQESQFTGSFLSPVIHSIEDRRRQCGNIDFVTILLLTDGELLDLMPLMIPETVRIVGLTTDVVLEKLKHWSRVLPHNRLYTLADRALDGELQADSYPFYGACQVTWTGVACGTRCYHLESRKNSSRPLASNTIMWNFLDGPLYLLFEAAQQNVCETTFVCTARKSGASVRSSKTGGQPSMPSELHALIERTLIKQPQDQSQIVLDVTYSSEAFTRVLEAIRAAKRLAEKWLKWVNPNGELIVLADPCFKNHVFDSTPKSNWDALICLCRGALDASPDDSSRIVLVGLQRNQHPALQWSPKSVLAFGTPQCSIEIDYVSDEDCWKIKYGDEHPKDLELDGSQVIDKQLLDDSKGPWIALFSGTLSQTSSH